MKTIRHIIWDWNGTLLDDLALTIDVMNGILAARAMPLLTTRRYHEVFDFPVRSYYERLNFDFAKDPFEKVSVEFITAYDARRLEAPLHAGVTETLAALRDAGISQSILSAYHRDSLNGLVGHFGLLHFFKRCVGLDNIHAHGKIDIGRQWVAELGLPLSQILLIGDTLHDAEVARALGVHCALVASGHHPQARLRAAGVPVYPSLHSLRTDLLLRE